MNIEEILNSSDIMNHPIFKKKYNKESDKYWCEWWEKGRGAIDNQLYILKDDKGIFICYCLIKLTDQLLNKNGCLLSYIYTVPNNRNKGYATALIKYLKSNFDSIVLASEKNTLNNFYKKLNFKLETTKIEHNREIYLIEQFFWNK